MKMTPSSTKIPFPHFAIIPSFLLLLFVFSCNQQSEQKKESISVIPQPLKIEIHKGHFQITPFTKIIFKNGDEEIADIGSFISDILMKSTGFEINVERTLEPHENSAIILSLDEELTELGDEGYELRVTHNRVDLKAYKSTGLFYGVQTLLQLLPPEIFGESHDIEWIIPCVYIFDKPQYSWRGMHLDVSRHFFPVDFIKRYIDLIAMHKMNVFHWHLTDDNGWRIEIKKYPLLTDISAWRVDREDQPWREVTPPKDGEKATYGGFYTQDEIKEIVEYAKKRHVEVIPEIEMPGHTSEVFAAYPELSCRGEKLYVQPGSYWPNVDIFCAGNDSVFVFLEDVLSEVIDLFPSKFIHVGGDEATKTRWEECPKCQNRIKNEGLADEEELQSYFIKRIESFLNEKGKKLIGWDEILEGGLAPEATVMSWRGFEGGIEAAEQGHDVIMCPVSHCYLDYYQADLEFQPVAIGGFTTLKKVYSFEPTPPELKENGSEHILGGQGNVWTEFISTPEHVEYMALPRMTALAEVLWTEDDQRDWDDFNKRLQTQFTRLDQMGANYCKGSFAVDIITVYDTVSKQFMVNLRAEAFQPVIRYTLDGSDPDVNAKLYDGPFQIDQSTDIKAAVFKDRKLMEKPSVNRIIFHKGIGKKLEYGETWNPKYPAKGKITLIDGIRGSDRHSDGCWHGFKGNNLDVSIDLGEVIGINKVTVGFFQRNRSWIFLPDKVTVSLSTDGENWTDHEILNDIPADKEGEFIKDFELSFAETKARYLKVNGYNMGNCPDWHQGAGDECWIFADEIIIE